MSSRSWPVRYIFIQWRRSNWTFLKHDSPTVGMVCLRRRHQPAIGVTSEPRVRSDDVIMATDEGAGVRRCWSSRRVGRRHSTVSSAGSVGVVCSWRPYTAGGCWPEGTTSRGTLGTDVGQEVMHARKDTGTQAWTPIYAFILI